MGERGRAPVFVLLLVLLVSGADIGPAACCFSLSGGAVPPLSGGAVPPLGGGRGAGGGRERSSSCLHFNER